MNIDITPEPNAEDLKYDREQVEKQKLEAEASWLASLTWPTPSMLEVQG